MKVSLPILTQKDDTIDRQRDIRYKEKMKQKKGTPHHLQVGDKVLARQKKENKLTPRFSPVELTVTGVQGSSVEASDGNVTLFRDASQFKPVESDEEEEEATTQPVEVAEGEAGGCANNGTEEVPDGTCDTAPVQGNNEDDPTESVADQPSIATSRGRRLVKPPQRFEGYAM